MLIKDAFEKTTGNKFPDNIIIRICDAEELKKKNEEFGGTWSPGIQGFAINKNPGTSLIFVKETNLDALMLTIGHEIGHVLTERLPDARDEEAKAFAFELAWMNKIKEYNIANLANQFVASITPANNGLHNVAFDFVLNMLRHGQKAIDVFTDLFTGETSIKTTIFAD